MATIGAVVLLAIGASSVFAELKGSLDEIWGIVRPGHSAFLTLLRTRVLSFSLVLAFLLLISLVCSAAIAMLERYVGTIWSGSLAILSIVSSIVSFGIIAILFAVIYKMLPDAPLSWRDVWIGAVSPHCY